jgi:hypothetical protein
LHDRINTESVSPSGRTGVERKDSKLSYNERDASDT